MRKRFACSLLVLGCLAVAMVGEPSEPPAPEEIVERILELRREIDALMAQLPPELRDEVRKQLAELDATPPADATAVKAPPAAVVPVRPEPAPVPVPEPPRRIRKQPACNTLVVFDTNQDGRVDSSDRYWRHLNLWIDRNGDGRIEEREISSPFDRGVREIEVDLEGFGRTKDRFGAIRIGEHIVLDLRGNGFDEGSRRSDDGVLLVDATALVRASGPRILSAAGEVVEGIQPFAAGWRIEEPSGRVTVVSCP
ncbi:MAG: hypothetical protein GY856_39010 [bacterium]|nr:hypothetical protein [bacterium]